MNKLLLIGGALALLGYDGVNLMDAIKQSSDVILAVVITLALQPWLAQQFD